MSQHRLIARLLAASRWRQWLPPGIKYALVRLLNQRLGVTAVKYAAELDFWQQRFEAEDGRLYGAGYEAVMLELAGEEDAAFCADKVVADFGCGPRGSLCWATGAQKRLGIDVLVDAFARFNIDQQPMTYVQCSEEMIPLADASVDVLFTLNALDHTHNFETMCAELLRILAPGGLFIASINLDGAPTLSEPQVLTESAVARCLLDPLSVQSYHVEAASGSGEAAGQGPRTLRVRAQKPVDAA